MTEPRSGRRSPAPGGVVEAVCVVHRVRPGYYHDTAIDKRPVSGPLRVGELGLDGDRQVDSSHGGRDAAVYVYAAEDAAHWAARLGRAVPPGLLGDNVRTAGLDVSGALLGERWSVGEVVLEVRKPRTPCRNLAMRMEIDDFHLEFNASGRVGAMCRVIETGTISAGDEIQVLSRPEHAVSVAQYVTQLDVPAARRLLAADISLASSVRAKAQRIVRSARRQAP